MNSADSEEIDSAHALAERLRLERLIVTSEQAFLREQNKRLEEDFAHLYTEIWIARHEATLLQRLNKSSDQLVTPENIFHQLAAINSVEVNPAHKAFGQHTEDLVEVFRLLHQNPPAVSAFLNATEKIVVEHHQQPLNNKTTQERQQLSLCQVLFDVLFGSCVFPDDEKALLSVLGHLIQLQLIESDDPRKLLRKGSTVFSQMSKLFLKEIHSAKIFLTAALHEPMLQLLAENEVFLDIDPEKSPIRYTAAERRRRFGADETTPEYEEKVADHRKMIVERLVGNTRRFMDAIEKATKCCFPSSLNWLVRQLYTSLVEKKGLAKNEAVLISTDLIFTCFICPALTNPEPLGIISETPISHVARFNLMQIGQLIQTLAMFPHERPPPHFDENIISRLDMTKMSAFVAHILNNDSMDNLNSIFPPSSPTAANSADKDAFRRTACVGTLAEFNFIIGYLKSPALEEIPDLTLRRNLKTLVRKLPDRFHENSPQNSRTIHLQNKAIGRMPLGISGSTGRLRNLADKVQNVALRGQQRLLQTSSVSNMRSLQNLVEGYGGFSPPGATTGGGAVQMQIGTPNTHHHQNQHQNNFEEGGSAESDGQPQKSIQLYFFTIPSSDASETSGSNYSCQRSTPLGLKSEDEVMSTFRAQRRSKNLPAGEKRTRFLAAPAESIVSDDTNEEEVELITLNDSINTVDQDDGEEEGEVGGDQDNSSSSTSTSSSNCDGDPGEEGDMSALPDNLSDVMPISANVSGRGSPSLSGRETPFSSSTTANNPNDQNDTSGMPSSAISTVPALASQPPDPSRRTIPTIPITVRKPYTNSEGLDDKFGKFGLPPQDPSRYRDETTSMVSDSWSTDVNGPTSDNEGGGGTSNNLSASGGASGGGGSRPLHASSSCSHLTAAAIVGGGSSNSANPNPTNSSSSVVATSQITPKIQQQNQSQNQLLSNGGGIVFAQAAPQQFAAAVSPTSNNSSAHSSPQKSAAGPTENGFCCDGSGGGLLMGGRGIVGHLSTSSSLNVVTSPEGSINNNNTTASPPAHRVSSSSKSTAQQNASIVSPTSSAQFSVGVLPPPPAPYFDPNNLTQCRAFADAKRKLRLVLSASITAPSLACGSLFNGGAGSEVDALNQLLDQLLAEAVNSQRQQEAAQIREVQRVLGAFDAKSIRTLLRVIRDEHWKRSHFQLYLQQSRHVLLQLSDGVSHLTQRIRRERELTAQCVVDFLVRLFLHGRENPLRQFIYDFQKLSVQDEKIELVDRMLEQLYSELLADSAWHPASESHVAYAHKSLERALMAQIYYVALYPNAEADVCRDEVFHNSVLSLSSIINVDHPELAIPKELFTEAPWPSAQQELAIINAYKSPHDKLGCVVRCCETIQNLVILGAERGGTASADDLLPVLVFVILKTNPMRLLSTIQFINGFYGARIQGSEAYWWTQFTSAVEFLKQLLNNLLSR